MTAAVVVPTYRRPDALLRCLAALARQRRVPDEVLVVVRDTDEATRRALEDAPLTVEVVTVTRPGQVEALRQGIAATACDVVAITDDDTEPHADWLERIVAHFAADARLGVVGGRDVVHTPSGPIGPQPGVTVGRVRWFGQVIGNHHLGAGPPHAIDVVKGANMALHRRAVERIVLDDRLRGSGAQVHNDMWMSLQARGAGLGVLYDPQVVVDHHPADRFDADARGAPAPSAVADAAYNETVVLLAFLSPARRAAFLAWAFAVGTRARPGVLHAAIALLRRRPEAGLLVPVVRARLQGLRFARSAR